MSCGYKKRKRKGRAVLRMKARKGTAVEKEARAVARTRKERKAGAGT